jgi:hypothetical protein
MGELVEKLRAEHYRLSKKKVQLCNMARKIQLMYWSARLKLLRIVNFC